MTAWLIEPHSDIDKSFVVTGPDGVLLNVDYDDVHHEQVDATVEAMVDALNAAEVDWPVVEWSEEEEEP